MRGHEISATYRITTPMFLGDADQKPSSLRPPSIRGALRFWWRASEWPRVCVEHADPAAALCELHQRETRLFGAASKIEGGEEQGGQRMLIRTSIATGGSTYKPDAGPGQGYLLGMGLFHFRDRCLRKAFKPDTSFTVRIRLRNKDDASIASISRALWLWGMLGGLGSRSRHGMGSVVLESLEGAAIKIPRTLDELKLQLNDNLPDLGSDLPPLTAFSKMSKVHCSTKSSTANGWQLLEGVGRKMMFYRSWGLRRPQDSYHKVLGQRAEQNFPDDHNEMQKAMMGGVAEQLPGRIVFGLPHNYFFSSPGHIPIARRRLEVEPTGERRARRASPLLLHIHQFPNGSHAAFHTLLPAIFLPSGDKISITGRTPDLVPQPNFKHITDFLDRFSERKDLLP